MRDKTIGDHLLKSCQDLYNKGIIERNQYKQCIDAMDGGEYFKKIQISEKNIFSSSREDKEKKYDDFINSIKVVVDEIFKKLEDPTLKDVTEKANINRALIQISILIKNVVSWIQNISIKRHGDTTEKRHYDQLLYYYNKIDNHRKELAKIKDQFQTLEKKAEHQEIRKGDERSTYIIHLNIMISLIVLVIICLVIIFLLYFI